MVEEEVSAAMRKLLAVLLGLLVFGAMGLAFDAEQVEEISMETIPPTPVEDEEVTLVLSGVWPDACVPTSYTLIRLGSFITVRLATRDTDCDPEPTPWELEASLGELSRGTYMVTVSYEGETILQDSFQVTEHVDDNNNFWDIPPTEPAIDCENPYFPPLVVLLSTVDEVPWGASLPVAMVVTTTAADHTFAFNTGQRYDFAVYKDGDEVWRWSDDQAFIMALGEETYTMDGTLYFERINTGELPGPGTYTLQGTLTTQGRVEGDTLHEEGPAHVCVEFVVVEG